MITQKLLNDFKNIDSVILSITNNCNLQCKYCFVNQNNGSNITLDKCYQIIDILSNDKNKEKEIVFFGGEPLLLWDEIIFPTIKYAKNKNIKFSITTNGTLLNEERIIFLKEHKIKILLSIDGDKITQDFNRPTKIKQSSFMLLQKNIPLILKYLSETQARATLYPNTINYFFNNYIFFIKQGFKKCFFCPDEFSVWTEEQKTILYNELQKITNYYITSFTNNQLPLTLFTPYEHMIKELLFFNFQNNNDNSKCGIGQQRVAIDYYGNIFGCQEFISQTLDISNFSYIGNINTGIDKEKQNFLYKKISNIIPQCENLEYCKSICNFKKFCQNHFCYANSYLNFNNFELKSFIECEWENMLYKECLTIIFLLNQNSLFLSHFLNINRKENKKCLLPG